MSVIIIYYITQFYFNILNKFYNVKVSLSTSDPRVLASCHLEGKIFKFTYTLNFKETSNWWFQQLVYWSTTLIYKKNPVILENVFSFSKITHHLVNTRSLLEN